VKFSLIPRNYLFYDLFERAAHNLVVASEALTDLLDHFENIEMKTNHIKELEHTGDDVTHELYLQLHQTFVTPLDREDIAALAQRMDDVMDYIEAAATAIKIYGIDEPSPAARSLADLIRLQCLQIERAIGNLRRGSNLRKIQEQLVEINRLENEADTQYLNASAQHRPQACLSGHHGSPTQHIRAGRRAFPACVRERIDRELRLPDLHLRRHPDV
jgi:hypothetical protein